MQKFRKKNIEKRQIWYSNFWDIFTNISPKNIIKLSVVIFCIILIFIFGSWLTKSMNNIWKYVAKKTIVAVSNIAGKEMKKDKFGHINILLIGIWWKNHAWWTLADTIIVASFDPSSNIASMVSIPRDMYIYEKGIYNDKINAVFAFAYKDSQWDFDKSAKTLSDKISQILSIEIPYYAIVDFDGFEKVIDTIWWIEIDVPSLIHDVTYPWPNNTYQTFRIEPWLQKLDGATALKYARSRHTTSDFSRSQRQQMIIKAILQQAIKTQNIISPSTIKSLYDQYSKMVFTNIESEEIVGLAKYSTSMPNIFSFGLTMECNDMAYKTMQAGCLLVPWNKDNYGWMSVLVPTKNWYDAKLDFYDWTNFFWYMVLQDNKFLLENTKISVYNSVDPSVARRYRYRNWFAGKVASKLIRYGFWVEFAGNANKNIDQTVLVVNWTWEYKETIKMLKLFIDLPIIKKREELISDIWPEKIDENTSRSDLEIYIWADFLSKYGNSNYDLYSR